MLNAHTKGCRRSVEIHFHVLSARLERVEDARRRNFSFALVRVDYPPLPYGITPARGDIADTNIHVHGLSIDDPQPGPVTGLVNWSMKPKLRRYIC